MTTQTVPIQVPSSLYHQLERLATLTNEIRDDLLTLEGCLEDDELW